MSISHKFELQLLP